MITAMAVTGATGFKISKGRKGKLIGKKKKRMPFIVMNGIFILIPAAILLDMWASTGQFDTMFWIIQLIEIIFGVVNLILLSMSIRGGLVLTGKLKLKR
ncbi:hypothetical protein [Bacillus solimangrovi]|uniref:hypothetical protein n=1 Tax=Bacillus solimangrovi TaxID=1305675 RepID=UPI001C2FA049|nr:hypothetical protein [Bacillus solimangrovi]